MILNKLNWMRAPGESECVRGETLELSKISMPRNNKSGREAAATVKIPHSYPESRVPKEVGRVKGFLGRVKERGNHFGKVRGNRKTAPSAPES